MPLSRNTATKLQPSRDQQSPKKGFSYFPLGFQIVRKPWARKSSSRGLRSQERCSLDTFVLMQRDLRVPRQETMDIPSDLERTKLSDLWISILQATFFL